MPLPLFGQPCSTRTTALRTTAEQNPPAVEPADTEYGSDIRAKFLCMCTLEVGHIRERLPSVLWAVGLDSVHD